MPVFAESASCPATMMVPQSCIPWPWTTGFSASQRVPQRPTTWIPPSGCTGGAGMVSAAVLALGLAVAMAVGPHGAAGYWQEECGAFPADGMLLPDNAPLDCALRRLALTYGQALLPFNVTARLAAALNLAACDASASGAGGGVGKAEQRRLEAWTAEVRRRVTAGRSPRATAVPTTTASTTATASTTTTTIYVDAARGSDTGGHGTIALPYASVQRAQGAARIAAAKGGAVTVRLRAGTYFFAESPFVLRAEDSGAGPAQPVTYAGYPGETAVLSGGAPLQHLRWERVGTTPEGEGGFPIYRAALPSHPSFSGLYGSGRRLTRARYPNCADITGTSCFLLNASGATSNPRAPTTSIDDVPGAINLEVENQNGVDMFADTSDSAPAYGPHGASDGSLPPGQNLTLVVDHPDYAWRCHEDCGWKAYAHWRSNLCAADSCRFNTSLNEPYWDQQVSGGFYYNATAKATPWAPAWTPRAWTKPGTGVVHMYHSARWGSWQFQLHSRNDTSHALVFACDLLHANGTLAKAGAACPSDSSIPAVVQGGWQEARGGAIGAQYTRPALNNSYFVENIREELDYPGEWFHDEDEGALYLVPPDGTTDPADLALVATRWPRVVQLQGDAGRPVRHVRLENVTIMHSAATFLAPYEVPSGGDYAIHRGGAVFLEGAVDVTVAGTTLDQVDGNGLFLSGYTRNCSLVRNQLYDTGDSGIVVAGWSGAHRTNQAATRSYPAGNLIERNYVNNVGVWCKQSTGYFKSITRDNTVRWNVLHDGPRSGINFNDGFAGGELLANNLLFNYVKESNDHGPFNSWDRQPYVFRRDEYNMNSTLAISPRTQTTQGNLILNVNFHGPSCGSIGLDHDDESSQYNDTGNVLVYGGIKAFDGMDRHMSDNLIVYPFAAPSAGPACFHALSSTRNRSSQHTHFFGNDCVLRPQDYAYNCGAGPAPFYNASYHVDVHSNTFYYPNATAQPDWSGVCRCYPGHVGPCPYHTFADWQARGHDLGSRIITSLSNADLLAKARALLLPLVL